MSAAATKERPHAAAPAKKRAKPRAAKPASAETSTADLSFVGVDFEAVLTEEQALKTAQAYDNEWGEDRRITLMALARSRAQLAEGFGSLGNDAGDVIMDMIERIQSFKGHAEALVELSDAAIARLMIVAGQALAKEGAL